MKRIVVVLLCFFSLIGVCSCGLFYSDEPAPALVLPQSSEIAKVELQKEGVWQEVEDEESVLALLKNAEPTTRESVNDSPYAETYYALCVQGEEERLVFGYLYERESFFGLISKWYFEVPYYGIYEVQEEHLSKVIEKK